MDSKLEETIEDVECRVEALESTVISEVRAFKQEIREQFEVLRAEVKQCVDKNTAIEEKVDKFEQTMAQKADDSVNLVLEEIASGSTLHTENDETPMPDNSDLQEFKPAKRHSFEILSSSQLALVKKLVTENESDSVDVLAMKIIKEGRSRKLWEKDFHPPGTKQPSFFIFMKEKVKNIRKKCKTQKYADKYKRNINLTHNMSDSD